MAAEPSHLVMEVVQTLTTILMDRATRDLGLAGDKRRLATPTTRLQEASLARTQAVLEAEVGMIRMSKTLHQTRTGPPRRPQEGILAQKMTSLDLAGFLEDRPNPPRTARVDRVEETRTHLETRLIHTHRGNKAAVKVAEVERPIPMIKIPQVVASGVSKAAKVSPTSTRTIPLEVDTEANKVAVRQVPMTTRFPVSSVTNSLVMRSLSVS